MQSLESEVSEALEVKHKYSGKPANRLAYSLVLLEQKSRRRDSEIEELKTHIRVLVLLSSPCSEMRVTNSQNFESESRTQGLGIWEEDVGCGKTQRGKCTRSREPMSQTTPEN